MRKLIVVEKYGKDRVPEYTRDEVLLDSINEDGSRLMSTASNGTILIKKGGAVFGPCCPNGMAVYERIYYQPDIDKAMEEANNE